MNRFLDLFLMGCCVLLGIAILFCLIRAIRGPRFADRVMSINSIGTMIIAIMAILSVRLDAGYLIDISIAYALLSFIAVVVLVRLVLLHHGAEHSATPSPAGAADTPAAKTGAEAKQEPVTARETAVTKEEYNR